MTRSAARRNQEVYRSAWVESSAPERIKDPVQAYEDVKEAHQWVSLEMDQATEPMRRWNLEQERKRLAGIAYALRRRF